MEYGLLLTPGAGADSESPALRAVADAAPANFTVRRMDFPYRLTGRKAPDRQPVLVAAICEGLEAFVDEFGIPAERTFIGGRSMGGRMCSMAAAQGVSTAGLVLMSYPLHPPGRPEKLRVEHFPDVRVPCLFVSGTRDSFGTRKEFEAHTPAIAGGVEQHWIEGGDHGMSKYNVNSRSQSGERKLHRVINQAILHERYGINAVV